jgi:hypothetical protein
MAVYGYADKPIFDNEDDDESFYSNTDGSKSTKTPREPVKFGVRIDLNKNLLQSGYAYVIEDRTEFHLGAIADIVIAQADSVKMYLQLGFMLSKKGKVIMFEDRDGGFYGNDQYGRVQDYNNYDKTTYTINAYSIRLPLMLSLKLPLTENLSLRANTGPYVDIGISGTLEKEKYSKYSISTLSIPGISLPSQNSSEEHTDYDSQDISKFLNIGIGTESGLEYSHFYFGIKINIGVTNVLEKYSSEAYDRTYGITIGYNFY